MKRLLVPALTSLALAVGAAAAHAAAWLPVQAIGTSATGHGAVAIDDAGRSTVVWTDDGTGASRVIARRIEPAGTLGAPLDLGAGESAAVGATAAGGAVATWWREGAGAGESEVVARAIGADDALGPARVVAATTAWLESDPVVSVAPGGAAVVAWLVEQPGDATPRLQARQLAADGTLGALIELGPADDAGVSAVTTADGVTRLLWERPRAGDGAPEVVAARIDAAGAPAAAGPVVVSEAPLIGSPHLSGGSGGAVATWFEGDAEAPTQRLAAARLPADGDVAGAPVAVAPDVAAGAQSQVAAAVAPDGTATIAWDEASAAGTPIAVRQLGPDGTLGATRTIAQSPAAGVRAALPFVRALGDGSLLAIWMLGVEPDGDRVYRSRMLAPDGAPTGEEQTLPVSPGLDGFDPRRLLVAVSAAGDGIAATGSAAGPLYAARFDGAPPALELTAPATVERGTAAAFAVSATDPAGIASWAWEFGDGASAAGAAASHAYAAAGSYEVTVTVTDGFGNRAVARRTVTVTEPDPGGRDPGGRDPEPGGRDPGSGGRDPGPGPGSGGDPDPGPGPGDPGPGDPGPGDPGPGDPGPGGDPGTGRSRAPAVGKASARLRLARAARSGARVTIAGTLDRRASGRVTLDWRQRLGGRIVRRTVRARIVRGRFRATIRLPRALAGARTSGRLTVAYGGDADTARATVGRLVRNVRAARTSASGVTDPPRM